jgi:putative membrane protein
LRTYWSLVASPPELAVALKMFFLSCVVIAGVFGAATVSWRILPVQAAPAALALLLTLLA